MLLFVLSLQTQASQPSSEPLPVGVISKTKAELLMMSHQAVSQCKCLASLIETHADLFPVNKEKSIKKGWFTKSFKASHSQSEIYDLVNDMKGNANKTLSQVRKEIANWSESHRTVQDIKSLELKVSETLRGMSSYCVQPYESLSQDIRKLSNKKIDLRKDVCLRGDSYRPGMSTKK